MRRWSAFGAAIAARMPVIVPVCVALGVLLPQVFSPIKPLVPTLFALMTFQGALSNTFHQLVEVFRRPACLLAILGVTMVAMPAVAWALACALFGGNVNLVTGVVLEYSVPIGIVSFMWVSMFGGNGSLALAAILVSTVLSPFTIPLTLHLLMGETVEMDAMGMMTNMIFMIALPAIAGMLVNDLSRGWGREKLSPVLSPACRLLLAIIITTNSTSMSEYVLHMTWERAGVMAFILVFAASGFAWGMLAARLMGQPFGTLVTMSFECGLRNISSGAVIAAQYFPGEVVFPVMCGTIFQQLLASVFGSLMRRLRARAEREA